MKPALMKCYECGTRVPPPATSAPPAPQAASQTPVSVAVSTPTESLDDFIRVACECGTQFRVKPEWAGRRRKCSKCSKPILVPQSTTDSSKSLEVAQLQMLIETAIRQLPEMPEVSLKNTLSTLKLRKLKEQLVETSPLDQVEAQRRRMAVLELGGSHDRRVFDMIAPIEKDAWEHLRASVARAIGMLDDPRGLPILLRFLADRSDEVVRESVRSLSLLRSPLSVLPLLRLGLVEPGVKLYAFDAIANIGVAAVPVLMDVVQHRDQGMLLDAVILLGRIGDASAVLTLLTTLEHTRGATRAYAIESLGRIGDKRAVPKLIELLADDDAIASSNALIALGKIPDVRALRAILPLLESPESDVQRHAIEALGEIGDPRAVPGLVKLLPHADEFQQDTLVDALVKIGDVNASEALLPLLGNCRIELLLKLLLWVKKAKPPAATSVVLELLEHSQSAVRRQAVDALGEISDLHTFAPISELLSHDSSFEVRAAAAKAIGKISQKRAIPLLEHALRDEFTVRCAAVIALGTSGDPSVAAALLSMLRDVTPEVRYHAVTALGKLGAKQAASAIQALLDDADPLVRQGAEKSLLTLGLEKPKVSLSLQLSRVISRMIPSHIAGLLPGRTLATGLIACLLLVAVGFGALGIRNANALPATALVGAIQSLVPTAEPTQVAISRSTGELEIWDASSGKKLKATKLEVSGQLVALGQPRTVCLVKQTQLLSWDFAKSDKLSSEPLLSLPVPLGSLAASTDGRVGVVQLGQRFQSWDLAKRTKLADLELDPSCKPAISGDGAFVLGLQWKTKKLIVLDAATGQTKQLLERDGIATRTVALDQTGGIALVSCPNKLLKIDLATESVSDAAVSGDFSGLLFHSPTQVLGWQGNRVLTINPRTLKMQSHSLPDDDSDDGISVEAVVPISGSELIAVRGNSKKHFWVLNLGDGVFKAVK